MHKTGIAAVTGARGLIGSRLIELLIESGWQVRALVREKGWTSELSVEVVQGDLTNRSDLEKLLEGVDTVFNCAGELSDESRMSAVNAEMPAVIAEISRDAGVGVFCHISSAGVVGPVRDEWIDETTPCAPCSLYEKSKLQGEQSLLQLSSSSMRICVIRPTNVIDLSSPGILQLATGNGFTAMLSLIFKGGEHAHLVHAKDVAGATLFVSRNEACHGVYFVGYDEDERNRVVDVINLAKEFEGRKPYSGPVLPVAVPYYLRQLMRGQSLHGSSRFSSARLIKAGYRFHYRLDEAIRAVCEGRSGEAS